MSQFNYFNDLNSALTMDGEITRGPMPRWKKKLEASSISLNGSMNASRSVLSTVSLSGASLSIANPTKTPGKNGDNKGKKTPTPNKGSKTPGGGDRFIPNRGTSNFELGHYLIKQEQEKPENDTENDKSNCNKQSPYKVERQKLIADSMQIADAATSRILCYQNKAPAAPESHQNPLKVVYSIKTPISTKSGTRYIPTSSDRILDAPDIMNDYYLNLMDWSADNIVTVALGNAVYLWNAGTGGIEQLVEYEEGYACALSWIQEGQILAIGNNSGAVELWDCSRIKRLRVMDGHTARVGALTWNSFLVSSGSKDGTIIHHDVRAQDHKVATLSGHTQEVCGLKWSTDFKYLASGGNDNLVNVWTAAATGGVGTSTEALHILNQHQAAVRALAWCPWQPNILATGGGTADRCIKFWNINNGTLLNSVDSKSQVCALLWSHNYKELISAHGFANNQLTIWKYPTMVKQAELTGHTSRVLQMAMSPDGSTVISAGADETLRLWNCFTPDPYTAKKSKNVANEDFIVKKCLHNFSLRTQILDKITQDVAETSALQLIHFR